MDGCDKDSDMIKNDHENSPRQNQKTQSKFRSVALGG